MFTLEVFGKLSSTNIGEVPRIFYKLPKYLAARENYVDSLSKNIVTLQYSVGLKKRNFS